MIINSSKSLIIQLFLSFSFILPPKKVLPDPDAPDICINKIRKNILYVIKIV
jgi:hypothetical protein